MEDTKEKHLQETVPVKKSVHWLQRLKDESWEAELLVSAIAIFGTFQLFGLIDWAVNQFIDLLPHNQYIIGYFIVFFGLFAVSMLVSMFVIHFFLRAYWIGLVGLNSVFPDYGLEDSAYSKIYTEKILSILPTQEETITKVDELCSVIFSAAFALLLIYAYSALISSIYLLIYNFLSDYIPSYILWIPLLIIGTLIILQTIFNIVANLKIFKNNYKIQHWFFKIVKLTSLLMYGPLYKSLLQISMTFGSNFKKKKALVRLVLLFFVSGIGVAIFAVGETNIFYLIKKYNYYSDQMYTSYYRNQNEDNTFLLTPEIQSDLIKGDIVRLFIPILGNEKNYQEGICGTAEENENNSRKERTLASRAYFLECYRKYNKVLLNGEEITMEYLKYDHERTNQFGIIGYIKNSKMKEGQNRLLIKKLLDDDAGSEWTVPFYYISEN